MKCEFCPAETGERIELTMAMPKGLAWDPMRVHACPKCVPKAITALKKRMDVEVADLPRRRAIVRLNDEVKELIAKGASPEEIAANREQKSALVGMRGQNPAALRKALAALEK